MGARNYHPTTLNIVYLAVPGLAIRLSLLLGSRVALYIDMFPHPGADRTRLQPVPTLLDQLTVFGDVMPCLSKLHEAALSKFVLVVTIGESRDFLDLILQISHHTDRDTVIHLPDNAAGAA
jgi:hypothetical protein